MNNLFDTKEKIDAGLAGFRALIQSPGWKLLEEILNENIAFLQEEILNGVENDTIENVRRLRDKLQAYKDAKNTPYMMIEKLDSQETLVPDTDPFDTLESLQAQRQTV